MPVCALHDGPRHQFRWGGLTSLASLWGLFKRCEDLLKKKVCRYSLGNPNEPLISRENLHS